MQNKEREIITRAIRELERATGFTTTVQFYDKPNGPDAIIGLENEDYKIEFDAELRIFINRARLGLVVNQLRGMGGRPLLVTEFVNPKLMETIEEYGINFIDATGNAYIKVPPLFIKIKGNKKTTKKTQKAIFNAAELRVIYTVLCNPGIENRTIRVVEEYTGVATGTVYNTFQKLADLEFMIAANFERYRLLRKGELLDRWVTLYPEKLKPKYLIGRYNIEQNLINNLQLDNYRALWGGEGAAARLTNYLQPFIHTIYIDEREGEFILRNRLKKDPKGNLILMKKFWKFPDTGNNIVHPVLVYADLLATGDPRNIETAKIIYEKEIVRHIQED